MFKIAKISGISGLLVLMLPLAVSAKTVSGTVAALHGSTIVLTSESGSSLNVDASGTNVQSRFGTKLDLNDINTGDSLRVNGKTESGSDLSATNIRDLSNQQRKAGFTGMVSAVSSTGFTLQIKNRPDQTVTVTGDTTITKQDKTASLSDIVAGTSVVVSGVWDSSKNTITAAKVVIIVRTVNISGTVSAVSGTTITLNRIMPTGKNEHENNDSATGSAAAAASGNVSTTVPVTWTVDASNAKLMKRFGGAMQLSDIQNGDTLQVNGTAVGTTPAITAKTIRDTSLQQRNGTFVGTVSALNGSSFSLQSKERGVQTINTTSSTKFLLGNAAGSISGLAVGQTVTVSGTWDRTNSNVTATRVMIKMTSTNINAIFKSANGTTLTVLGSDNVTYTVDASQARIRGANGAFAALSAFTAGDALRIGGRMVSGSTSITASEIRDLNLKTASKNETEHSSDLVHPIAPMTPLPVPAANPGQ